MDASSFSNKLGPHRHEEGIENVQRFSTNGQETTVETTSKLDNIVFLFCLSPCRFKLICTNTKYLASFL